MLLFYFCLCYFTPYIFHGYDIYFGQVHSFYCDCWFMHIYSNKKIKIVLYLIVFINLAYSVLLLLYPDRSDAYMQGDANYLNVTLTIGCALTICLAYFYIHTL